MLNFHLDSLDLSKLLDSNGFSKRSTTTKDWASQIISSTGNSGSAVESLAASAESTVSSWSSDSSNLISQITQLDYSDLGLADVYQLSFWGYCKGSINGTTKTLSSNEVGKQFDNSNVNITWCSKPKVGYKFDPLVVFKQELNSTLQEGVSSTVLSQEISYLLENLTYDNLNLPGDLSSKIKLFGNLQVAAFGLLLAGAVLAVISIIIQLLGCFMSPDSCCLSFLNFLFECLIFIVLLVGSILITFTMSYTKTEINKNTDDYGVKSFLSINFYAFIWSGAVAALLCTFFNLLGHCCGLFSTGRKKFRSIGHDDEPEMVYSHHDAMSDAGSYKTEAFSSHHSSHHSHH